VADPDRRQRAERQRELVASCRDAMPDALDLLWETILHAPSEALPAVVDGLEEAFHDERARMRAVLAWLGHGEGRCPVCWMLVGKVVYTFDEPVQRLAEHVGDDAPEGVLDGAALFLGSHLEPRHARAAGLTAERLEDLRLEVRELPGAVKAALLTRREDRGADASGLRRALEGG